MTPNLGAGSSRRTSAGAAADPAPDGEPGGGVVAGTAGAGPRLPAPSDLGPAPDHDAGRSSGRGTKRAGRDDAPEPDVHGDRVDWATVPRVNLLPQEIIDQRRFRRTQRVLAGVVGSVVVLCALATVWAQAGVASAEAELAVVRAETLDLQRQQAAYAEVPKLSAALEAARAAREQALATDVLWFRFLTDLAVFTPPGTVLTSVSISMTGSTSAKASNEPLQPASLGTVKVSGQASRFADVASWLESAARVNGLDGSQLQTAARSGAGGTAGSGEISYSGSAVVTPAALSHRFDRKAG